jgi:hypothetical protein
MIVAYMRLRGWICEKYQGGHQLGDEGACPFTGRTYVRCARCKVRISWVTE